ncbi:C2 calcium/lipid-binding plant phosphoribosyltransferase family protein [Striga hermonthica]|uniref:C2 calcium/lipid-binding plant phosphoribosyltransferase family protein n=1 Tax=Striga hermonthica TaxID=68872 RepID=A0A9N7N0D5_STRHE|nr:C2 calcium/lipid-binding plant phosphoribosyltransferase family protein [Striga hermonthica]
MAKLVVEVLDAGDLMPKDGHGSASPFVEVDFDGQLRRTSTKPRDLNPVWKETLVFAVEDPGGLPGRTVEVFVYNDGGTGRHRNFLGKVRISGASVPPSESQAASLRYPLEKRGPFSHVRGDLALRIFTAQGPAAEGFPIGPQGAAVEEDFRQTADPGEVNRGHRHPNHPNSEPIKAHKASKENLGTDNGFNGDFSFFHKESNHGKEKKKKKEKEVRTFHSLGTGGGPPPPPPEKQPPFVEPRADFVRSGGGPPPSATVMQMQFPGPKPEYGVVETRPPLAARTGYWGRDKTASTYDLVEQMNFLYVNVVKARDLPVMDITGSLDPYVEVRVGNYRGVTRHLEKNQNPIWKSVFAFANERVQSSTIEVTVKDKDLITKDDFVGKVNFDIRDIPQRVPPDSPLAPQWYRLTDKRGQKLLEGEIMLAVWIGTQADEAFPEAWHSDAHNLSQQSLASTRSKVYFSPKLYYLRVHIISAQDLIPSDRSRPPDTFVRIQVGHQVRTTRPSSLKHANPEWNEELMFVASEPFDEYVVVSVEGKDEVMGRIFIPVREVPHRVEHSKLPEPRWFALLRPSVADEDEKKKEIKFASRILIRLCLDSGYHVLDESTHFSSDLQPSSKHLRKPSIGLLELGILSARNLLPMKGRDGKLTDAYCVAKYGNKWVRTRTLLDTLHPRWNEQYTWEVHDPCTVITVGVFDNCHVIGNGDPAQRDQRIGKVRIRLSTLETDRIYTHSYPLLVLTPSGLKKHGELHLALRFTCTAWVNMVAQYGKPLLPKMHYVQPISVRHIDWLRHQAMQIVALKLSRAEPPLRKEIVEYMVDVDYHMFSLRRSKANFHRIMSLLSGISYVCRWFDGICYWKNPLTTILVHVLFLILVCYPELILPTVFLYLFVIGIWNYRFRPKHPPHMDARLSQAENAHPDELDEEFDTFPTSRPSDLVRMRYDRLRSVAGRVQTVIGDLATQGERALSILGWRDPRATAIFIVFSLVWAVFLYVTPFQVVAVLVGLYVLRHPRFRIKENEETQV